MKFVVSIRVNKIIVIGRIGKIKCMYMYIPVEKYYVTLEESLDKIIVKVKLKTV